jgi:hypothetical protein
LSALIPEYATNDYRKLAKGEIQEVYEEPYAMSMSFAKNFKSNLTFGSPFVTNQYGRDFYQNKVAESGLQTAALAYQSKELLDSEKFKDPYGTEFKKLLYDMYANDYVAAEAVNIRNWSAFAPQTQVTCMPMNDRVYESEEELLKDLDDAMDESERTELIAYAEKVNRFTNFRYHQQDLGKQSMVGGRAALFIETFEKGNPYDMPAGTPAILKPLHWSYLNQVRVNTATWGFDSVRYTDFETKFDNVNVFIPGYKLLYVTRNDHHITPNNLWYGLSDFHSIWKISNIIRQCEEIDIPEIITSFWSGGGWFEFQNMNTEEMDNFMKSLGPGLIRGFNSKVKFNPYNLKHDGWFIMTLLQNMIGHMLMKLRVPEFLFSFDKANSRSAVEIQMNAFRDVVLAGDRWWMEQHLQDQWYDHLVGLYTKELDPRKHKVRLVQNYKTLSFEDILAKANSIELLSRRFITDRFESRGMLNLKPQNKNLDSKVNAIGEKLDLSPVEKLQQAHADKMQKEKMKADEKKQTTMDQFGQKGFTNTAPQRTNSGALGSVGAGRGNKT